MLGLSKDSTEFFEIIKAFPYFKILTLSSDRSKR